VAPDALAVGLARGQHDLLGIDDHDVVTGVEVRGEGGLVLAAQDAGDLGAHPAEDETVGVDDVPLAIDLAGFRGVGAHARRPSKKGTGLRYRALTTATNGPGDVEHSVA